MVSYKLCERLAALGQLEKYQITMIGEEPHAAYDRVNLSAMFRGRSISELALHEEQWFEQQDIQLHTGDPVTHIDPEAHRVRTDDGREFAYDRLILATGSKAIRPKMEGAELSEVHVYRTQDDVRKLKQLIQKAQQSQQPIAVMGAGLLGLELTEAICEAGVRVELIEAADHMLPRQLTPEAAHFAQRSLEQLNCQLHFGTRVSAIHPRATSGLRLQLSTSTSLDVAGAVFAVGVRPRDELARNAGLQCDLYGGVDINDGLQTSNPDIYAIGECARLGGYAFGLIAPGYEMADVLARRLSGQKARFIPPEPATHLKMKAVELSAVGQSSTGGVGMRTVVYQDKHCLRTLVLENNKVVGASAIGEWDQFGQLCGAIAKQRELKPKHEKRFLKGENVWGPALQTIQSWPDSSAVCSCTGVNCGTLRSALTDGCGDVESLSKRTGAGSVCGSCKPTLKQLIEGGAASIEPPSPWLWGAASLALLAVVIISSFPPIAYSQTVQGGFHIDVLWRDSVLKQLSGYSLLALFLMLAAFSLRKRWAKVRFGKMTGWRATHSVIGAAAITGTVVHTGMRLGQNLDFLLMLTVLLVTALGAGTSLVIAFAETLSPTRSAALRRYWASAHLWATWPLPLLLAIHILRAYFF